MCLKKCIEIKTILPYNGLHRHFQLDDFVMCEFLFGFVSRKEKKNKNENKPKQKQKQTKNQTKITSRKPLNISWRSLTIANCADDAFCHRSVMIGRRQAELRDWHVIHANIFVAQRTGSRRRDRRSSVLRAVAAARNGACRSHWNLARVDRLARATALRCCAPARDEVATRTPTHNQENRSESDSGNQSDWRFVAFGRHEIGRSHVVGSRLRDSVERLRFRSLLL